MAITLYKRQRQIIDFISQYIQSKGYAPTLKEIAAAIGKSAGAVRLIQHRALANLRRLLEESNQIKES